MPSELDPAPTISPLALRPREAAAAMGMSPRTLWSLTASGEIPHVKISGRMVLYPVTELQRWLSERAQKAAPAATGAK